MSHPTRVNVIVNPTAGAGKAGRSWPLIANILSIIYPDMIVHTTESPGHASELAANAIENGADLIIAVGGDGTLNEVVNGFFDIDGELLSETAQLSMIAAATGGDVIRSFDISRDWMQTIPEFPETEPSPVDVGLAKMTSEDGKLIHRYFLNVSSIGCRAERSRFRSLIPADFFYKIQALMEMRRVPKAQLQLVVDGTHLEPQQLTRLVVANGRYFGGGLQVAPHADPRDGLLELMTLDAAGAGELRKILAMMSRNQHLEHPKVAMHQGKKITIKPVSADQPPVYVEVDGEPVGQLPATFEILPGKLQLRM